MDPQVFGVVASFPIVFISASLVSALDILVVIQFTVKQLPVALSSFFVANLTAALVGSQEGPRWEKWYISSQNDYINSVDIDREGQAETQRVVKKRFDDAGSESRVLLPPNALLSHAGDELSPRNKWFYGSILTAVIIANLVGMVWGSFCAQHFPTRLTR